MVGLSIVLETFKNSEKTKDNRKVINKATVMRKTSPPPSRWVSPSTSFLDRCFLCKRKLLAGKDIYMYKGDGAFCTVECRSNQILMDEEETKNNSKACLEREKCSLAAIKGAKSNSSSSSSTSMHNQKSASSRNGANCFVF